ncbi:unnamed protein product, partial [Prorocentrum cordatum]
GSMVADNLPNRDCDAKASNGEICCYKGEGGRCDYDKTGDCAEGLEEYKVEYVDPFVEVLKEYESKLPIVVVLEPDSLPNLATNLGHPHCGNPATVAAYTEGIGYALERLTTQVPAVSVYLDAAHGGWLGWEDNLEKFMALLKDAAFPMKKIRGFATNVANYQPLGHLCPFCPDQGWRNAYCLNGRHRSDPCCADPCRLLGQYSAGNNELNYAQDLIMAANALLEMDAHAIIDTGRNGVVDMRQDCENWCNPRNAGAGIPSTTDVANTSLIDAYYWLKTPGESDGCSQQLPDGTQCPRFDDMCGSADSIGSRAGEPRAPEAGAWFDYQVKQLAANAHLEPPEAATAASSASGFGACGADLQRQRPQPLPPQQPQPLPPQQPQPLSGAVLQPSAGASSPWTGRAVGAGSPAHQQPRAQQPQQPPAQAAVTAEPQAARQASRPQPARPWSGDAAGPCAQVYQQCGGARWTGPTCCAGGSACVAHGDFYSQCAPSPEGAAGGELASVSSVVGIMRKSDARRRAPAAARAGGGALLAQALPALAAVPVLIAAASAALRLGPGRGGAFRRLPLEDAAARGACAAGGVA